MKVVRLILLSLILCSSISAFPTYRDLTKKSQKKIKVIQLLNKQYPITRNKINLFDQLHNEFKTNSASYHRGNRLERRAALKELNVIYKKINIYTKKLCLDMKTYSEEIMIDFTDRIKDKKSEELKPKKYVNAVRVARQEFSRAESATRNLQFDYSAHLYHQGIVIMKKTYSRLQWSLPPAFQSKENNHTISSIVSKSKSKQNKILLIEKPLVHKEIIVKDVQVLDNSNDVQEGDFVLE